MTERELADLMLAHDLGVLDVMAFWQQQLMSEAERKKRERADILYTREALVRAGWIKEPK